MLGRDAVHKAGAAGDPTCHNSTGHVPKGGTGSSLRTINNHGVDAFSGEPGSAYLKAMSGHARQRRPEQQALKRVNHTQANPRSSNTSEAVAMGDELPDLEGKKIYFDNARTLEPAEIDKFLQNLGILGAVCLCAGAKLGAKSCCAI